jgi:TonB family protein
MKRSTVIILMMFLFVLGLGAGFLVTKLRHQSPRMAVMTRYSELHTTTVIKRTEPVYPPSALKDRIEGTVRLTVEIGADSSARSVRVVKGVREDLDGAAKEAVMSWKFAPLTLKNKSATAFALVSIDFKLEKEKSKK